MGQWGYRYVGMKKWQEAAAPEPFTIGAGQAREALMQMKDKLRPKCARCGMLGGQRAAYSGPNPVCCDPYTRPRRLTM